jgi:predicted transcriptional regulator
MTTPKRVTKRDNFLALSRLVVNSDVSDDEKVRLSEFISHEVSLLDKKHGAKKTPTKTQLENVAVKAEIVDALAATPEGLKATPLAEVVGISVQKCSALLRQLVAAGDVVRTEKGKDVVFSVKD